MKLNRRQLKRLIRESFFKDLFKKKTREKTEVPEDIADDFGGGSEIELSDEFEQNPGGKIEISRRNLIKGAIAIGSIAAINKGLSGIISSGDLGGGARSSVLGTPFLIVNAHDVNGDLLYVAVEIDKEAFELLEYILKERNPEDSELAGDLVMKISDDVEDWVRANIELNDYYVNGYGSSDYLNWGEIPRSIDPEIYKIAEYYIEVVRDGFDFFHENL